MKRLIYYLRREKYPYYFDSDALWRISLLLVVVAFFFNYLLEPFSVNRAEHRMDFFWICWIHSVLPGLIGFTYFSVLNAAGASDTHWTVGKELLSLTGLLALVGLGNFLVRDVIYDNPYNWSWGYFWEELRNTFLAGTLLIGLIVPVNFERLYRKHRREAEAITVAPPQAVTKSRGPIAIEAQVKADHFELPVERLLFARAEGNYTELWLAGEPRPWLKRLPLKELERQLAHVPEVVRTHRSYLVNILAIQSVAGNAQGYQLSFAQCDHTVPVARGLIGQFREKLQQGG